MRWIGPIIGELGRLFVDDGLFALSILGWVAVVALLLPLIALPASWRGVILFAGLAAALVWTCLRNAIRKKG